MGLRKKEYFGGNWTKYWCISVVLLWSHIVLVNCIFILLLNMRPPLWVNMQSVRVLKVNTLSISPVCVVTELVGEMLPLGLLPSLSPSSGSSVAHMAEEAGYVRWLRARQRPILLRTDEPLPPEHSDAMSAECWGVGALCFVCVLAKMEGDFHGCVYRYL